MMSKTCSGCGWVDFARDKCRFHRTDLPRKRLCHNYMMYRDVRDMSPVHEQFVDIQTNNLGDNPGKVAE